MLEGKEWCTHTPHFEGEEVFSSIVQKLNLPLGSEFDSYHPEKMNFSHPKVQRRTRKGRHESAPTTIDLSSPFSPTSSDGIRIMSPPPLASNVVGV